MKTSRKSCNYCYTWSCVIVFFFFSFSFSLEEEEEEKEEEHNEEEEHNTEAHIKQEENEDENENDNENEDEDEDEDDDDEEEEEGFREYSDDFLKNHSHFWLLDTINNKAFESEMEIGYIVLRYLAIHDKSLQPAIIQSIVKAVRVANLQEYFITQILPYCIHFDMTKEKIAGIKTASPIVPVEWCLPPREHVLEMPTDFPVFKWCANVTGSLEFVQQKKSGRVHLEPKFVNFYGVIMESRISFNPPNIVVEVEAFFPLYSISVTKINCEFKCYLIKGPKRRKFSGTFSDSVVTLTCNMMDWWSTNQDTSSPSSPFNYYEFITDVHVFFEIETN